MLEEKGIDLWVKRDDLIHPEIMGNKWRKLKYNLKEMERLGTRKIVTLGGAFSNHIAATAAAGKVYGLETVGIIRGEELQASSNPTLQKSTKNGMKLTFIDRETFRQWREHPSAVKAQYPHHYFLPEGGTNQLALKGCREIIEELPESFNVIACPIGTGGTFCGILSALGKNQKLIGISSLKGNFIHKEITRLVEKFAIKKSNYELSSAYHFGGYGKATEVLIDFINWFKEYFDVPLDPVYTGKAFFAVWDMVKSGKFEEGTRIILLHTGGLQGISGFNRKNENILQ